MDNKLNILFIHSNIGQFKALHRYFNESKLANSWLICSKHAYKQNKDIIPNLIPFTPHGNKLESEHTFFYTKKLEEVHRRSLGYVTAIQKILKQRPIDLIVSHGTSGAPLMLFDEFNIPVVSYIEFPSFKAHGWDAQYPPTREKQRRDRSFEMMSYYNVMKSAQTITPSQYAKSLFPNELHDKITPQMEGFEFKDSVNKPYHKTNGNFTIGFCARDLSSAKGIEHFLIVSKKLLAQNPDLHFTIIGSPKLLYSYEQHFLDKKFDAENKPTFIDYLINRENLDLSKYTFTGQLPYEKYRQTIDEIDIFHYPIQFSSGSWGLFELLSRGKIVIGSDRCYLPEVLKDNENGFIVEYGDIDAWVVKTLEILSSPDKWQTIETAALETAKSYSIEKIAPKFLKILNDAVK